MPGNNRDSLGVLGVPLAITLVNPFAIPLAMPGDSLSVPGCSFGDSLGDSLCDSLCDSLGDSLVITMAILLVIPLASLDVPLANLLVIPFAIALAIPLVLLLAFPWASQFAKRRGGIAPEAGVLNVCQNGQSMLSNWLPDTKLLACVIPPYPFQTPYVLILCRSLKINGSILQEGRPSTCSLTLFGSRYEMQLGIELRQLIWCIS